MEGETNTSRKLNNLKGREKYLFIDIEVTRIMQILTKNLHQKKVGRTWVTTVPAAFYSYYWYIIL
jgi:hypothetical protein